jgi:hypothetical protein
VSKDGHKEGGRRFLGLGEGSREGSNVIGLQSQDLGEIREGTMLRGDNRSIYAVMAHKVMDREGN